MHINVIIALIAYNIIIKSKSGYKIDIIQSKTIIVQPPDFPKQGITKLLTSIQTIR